MKNIILAACLVVFFSNCEKLKVKEDVLPSLIMLDPQDITPTGVDLSSEVLESEISIETKGFCWSEVALPTINDFTIEGEEAYNNSSYFFGRASNLKPDTKYYFRSYATTVQGTGYSEELVVDIPPVPAPPCEMEENTLQIEESTPFNYENVRLVIDDGEYEFKGSSSFRDISIVFKQMPETREYKTEYWYDLERGDATCSVRGLFTFGFLSETQSADDDQTIYVEAMEDGKYRIEFCDLKINSTSYISSFICNGHFVTD